MPKVPSARRGADDEEVVELENAGYSGEFYARLASRARDAGEYLLVGDIDVDSAEMCGLFLLDALASGRPMATIRLCSGVGDEDAALFLVSIVEHCKASGMTVRVVGAGCVGSAALDVFSACSRGFRLAFETTSFMTHSSSGYIKDDEDYKLRRRFDKWVLKTYTNVSPAVMKRFLKTGNWWFDAEKAVGYGIVDGIVKVGERLPEGPVEGRRKTRDEQKADLVADGDEREDD